MKRGPALLALTALLAMPVARAAADEPAAVQAGVADQIALFSTLCLNTFPDDAAVSAFAKAQEMLPMSVKDLEHFVQAHAGSGWFYKAAGNSYLYVITIEAPPYHACSIRRQYSGQPAFEQAYEAALAAWAGANHGVKLEKTVERGGQHEGQTVHAVQQPVTRDGKLAEMMTSIATALPNGVTEVRLVRQIPSVN
jgi:hypothetical protein